MCGRIFLGSSTVLTHMILANSSVLSIKKKGSFSHVPDPNLMLLYSFSKVQVHWKSKYRFDLTLYGSLQWAVR